MHAQRHKRYGHPLGRPVKMSELKEHREVIDRALQRYAASAPVKAALELVSELLAFQPRYGWAVEREVQAELRRLTGAGVTPLMVLQRVVETYVFLKEHPQRCKTLNEELYAYSRGVCCLSTQKKDRPNARTLKLLGEMLVSAGGAFAVKLWERILQENQIRNDLKKQSANFDGVPLCTT